MVTFLIDPNYCRPLLRNIEGGCEFHPNDTQWKAGMGEIEILGQSGSAQLSGAENFFFHSVQISYRFGLNLSIQTCTLGSQGYMEPQHQPDGSQ